MCPWQARLRSWLALSHLCATTRPPLAGAFSPGEAQQVTRALTETYAGRPSRTSYIRTSAWSVIRTSAWSVPLTWFAMFSAAERWLVLGPGEEAGATRPAAAPAARALIYATAMAQARRRLARGLAAVRRGLRGSLSRQAEIRRRALAVSADLEDVACWLEEFHPQSVVELDYGGLVQLLTDDALRGDQSVPEIGAAISGLAQDEPELAIAMYRRAASRGKALRAAESAN